MAEITKKEHVLMEGNLLEYPIFSMERRKVSRTMDEYIWVEKDSMGKDAIERKFKVNCVYGIPNAYDMNIFNGIMRIYVKNKEKCKKNEVHFTIYELMRELELPVHSGEKVNRVRESLQRMANTSLHFENAFLVEKEKMTIIVHLLVRVEIYEKQKGDRSINMVKVVLDDELVNSIEKKYYKLIDFKVYKSLNSGIPRRLYEYLEKKKYKKTQFEIDIKKLARWMGLKTSKISQLKELLGKANNELKEKGVIDKWKYQKNIVVY